MHKKSLIAFLFLVLFSTAISASEQTELETSLYLISPKGDYIGQGLTYIYKKNDGVFSFNSNGQNFIDIFFRENEKEDKYGVDWWSLHFGLRNANFLVVGKYLNCSRFGDAKHPGLDIGGCGRGHNDSTGKFEIFDISFDESGNVVSFAANAQQGAHKNSAPLFTSIRYNSRIPAKASVSDIYGKRFLPKSFFYYITNDVPSGIENPQPKTDNDEDVNFDYSFYSDGEEGIIINIEEHGNTSWWLEFITTNDTGFKAGIKEDTRENDYDYYMSRPQISVWSNSFRASKGQFEVLSFQKNKYGEIEELALNFKVPNLSGGIIEGAIRYHSDLPVNLDHPFDN
jgi:hypothetical protein